MRKNRGRRGSGCPATALALLAGTAAAPSAPGPATLEDIYGDSGNSFQAAIGFVDFEGTPTNQSKASYGLAVDDLVIKWREVTLAPDAGECAAGSCASIKLATTNVFEGRTVLGITVLESTPPASNDCDLDGSPDAPADQDCDDDGTCDLVVKVSSQIDTGEIVILDQVAPPDGKEYKGQVAISTLADAPDVVLVGQNGAELPVVTATYFDADDGAGAPCPNDVNPASQGYVRAATVVFIGPTCEVQVAKASIEDNGDHDAYADTDETIAMRLSLVNHCGIDLHDCTARISTSSPTVACILESEIDVGNLADSVGVATPADTVLWRVAAVQRASLTQDLPATFQVTMRCDEIEDLAVPQQVSLQLDYDLDDLGQTPQSWAEGFESGTLGKFVAENLDGGIPGNSNAEGLTNGDGWRCQYNDPDWPNSNTYGSPEAADCFPVRGGAVECPGGGAAPKRRLQNSRPWRSSPTTRSNSRPRIASTGSATGRTCFCT